MLRSASSAPCKVFWELLGFFSGLMCLFGFWDGLCSVVECTVSFWAAFACWFSFAVLFVLGRLCLLGSFVARICWGVCSGFVLVFVSDLQS